MLDIKSIIGAIAVSLVFIGYVPYVRDVIQGKTIPHLYSWFLWTFVTLLVFALQLSDGAGPGSFVTLAAAMCSGLVIILTLRQKGKRDITRSDTFFFLMAFVSLGAWLIAKQPVLSAILATTTEVLGFAPTIRKTWKKPFTETLSLYALNTFRFLLALLALSHYSIVTTLYPASWLIGNGAFTLMLILRRRVVKNK